MAVQKKHAAWAAVAVLCVSGFEGIRTTAYRDPVGIPTICFGETKDVHMGDTKTAQDCRAMLEGRLWEFHDKVWQCIPSLDDMPAGRQAAIVSLAYNIGVGALCKSSVVRLLNAGQVQAGCDAFLKFNRAGGVVFKGLTRRREEERRLCLQDA